MASFLFSLKVYRRGKDIVVAIADEELLGREFKEGRFRLKVGKFYEGRKVTEEEAMELLKEATVINAVGKRALKLLERLGIYRGKGALTVAGVPHVQIVYYRGP